MIPKFRAYDSGSLCRMYQPDEVMVGDGNIWIIDEDSVAGEWTVNNDLELMQSTGLKDKNGKEIFEGDIIDTTDYEGGLSSVGNPLVKVERDKYGFVVTGDFPDSPITLEEFEDGRKFAGVEVIIAGNIYENIELLEVEE